MNLLITGIHGFVGTNLTNALKSKHTIYGLDIVTPEKEGVRKTFLWSEIDQLPHVDVIIHLAGKAHDTKNQTNAQVYFDVNTGLTQKIYDYFLQSDASKFLFFSSVKAAADQVVGEMLFEDVVPTPVGPYGESKIAAENYLLQHQESKFKNQDTNLDNGEIAALKSPGGGVRGLYILRPCMIHGPGNKGNLNLLYGFVNKGLPYPLGSFENKRSFTSIDNLSFIIDGMIDKDIDSGIYNVADDEPLSTNELIRIIAKSLGKKARIWNFNPEFITLLAKIGSVCHLPLNTDRLQKLTENYVVSNQKIKMALQIDKLPVRATDGLTQTILSFLNA